MRKLKVGIAGFGVVGKRRFEFINKNQNLKVIGVCDKYMEKSSFNNDVYYFNDYKDLFALELDILFVCLTNNIAAEVTIAGLKNGLHVFCEKPPGMNVSEIKKVIDEESKHPNLKLKYGFNHRYHYSVIKAKELIDSGNLGVIINLRGLYGKSRVIPFDGGWRSERKLAGGGILLDQGIHMLDLMRLFCDEFVEVKSFVSNDYWKHDVEDNAYAIMKDKKGRIAMINSSATEWQHKFRLEISLTNGYINLSGILSGSKSYGEEKIVYGFRDQYSNNGQMESVSLQYLQDDSWKHEIDEFTDIILQDAKVKSGSSNDAYETMKLVYSIYNSDKNWASKFKIENLI